MRLQPRLPITRHDITPGPQNGKIVALERRPVHGGGDIVGADAKYPARLHLDEVVAQALEAADRPLSRVGHDDSPTSWAA